MNVVKPLDLGTVRSRSAAKATFPYGPNSDKDTSESGVTNERREFLSAWKAKSRTFLDRRSLSRQPVLVPRL